MARLIVWAKANEHHSDALFASRKYSRGDVVDIVEDGQEVGREVESSEWWRVIEIPGKRAEFELFLGSDPISAVEILRATLPRKRVYRVDLDSIEKQSGLASREQAKRALRIAELKPVKVAPTVDPRVIGKDEIG